jgi:FlaA1/EpsC-like NDP-sugar epimerase
MLDRDESALHATQLSMEGRALLDSPNIILADIRDSERVRQIFSEHRPEIVFHAAALKHLPLLQRFPGEAVKTNVWGTLSVLGACEGVERFVNVSTDKAADPTSVLGWSKRIAERVTATGRPGTVCVSVRFGNVLGSRGSVLHTFAAQAAQGGPITVTHPETTRYFMTVTEAVHLIIAAGGVGRDGEALVLDMGEPINIHDVARQVCADDPVPIEFTGLRPGEKLHEQLFGAGEQDDRPIHPLISHVSVPPLDPALTLGIDAWDLPKHITEDLMEVAVHGARVGELPVVGAPLPWPAPQRSGTEVKV